MIDNIANTRRGFAAFAAGDIETLRELLDPDVVWHVPGRSSIAGDYRGIDATIGYFLELFERSGGTFRAKLVECAEIAPDLVSCLVRLTGSLTGGPVDQRTVMLFHEKDGRTVEVENFPSDQYALDEADGQTPAAIVRRGYDAFATGDMATLQEIFAPDIEWVEPGRHALAGTYRGVDSVLSFFGALMERSSGTFRVEPIGCVEIAPGTVAAQVRVVADLPGGSVDTTGMHAFTITDGRVTRFASYPADQHALDAAMGAAITLPDARTAEQAQPIAT